MSFGVTVCKLQTVRLTPTEAEVWVTLSTGAGGDIDPSLKVRGRLTGPRCPFSTTVEVAYYWHPFRHAGLSPGQLAARLVIPEPNWWSPETPFLYRGSVEVWRGDERLWQAPVTHGLRTAAVTPRGVLWNGRPLVLVGLTCGPEDMATDEAARRTVLAARQRGVNLLVVPAAIESSLLWFDAEEYGCLMLGRFSGTADERGMAYWHAESALSSSPACFAWLLPQDASAEEYESARSLLTMSSGNEPLLGVELQSPPDGPLPAARFLACWAELLPRLAGVNLPRLVFGSVSGEAGGPLLGIVTG